MSLVKELKKIIRFDSENIQLIQYIVFEYVEYFYGEYLDKEKKEFLKPPNEFYSIRDELSNVFEKTCRKELLSPGEIYEKIIPLKLKKKYGQVYTPADIVEKMVDELVDDKEFIKNPFVKYLDPACGSGYFLVELYYKLRKIFDENEYFFSEEYNIKEANIDKHIIENNLYGFDIDSFSCFLSIMGINIASRSIFCSNIKNEDYLFFEVKESFQAIIGNPPYIGHKNLKIHYKKELNNRFLVYNDKSDISYCFFEKALKELDNSGKLLFITSRYFVEADNAGELRTFLKNNYGVEKIVDYSGLTLFKNTGVSPVIISLIKDFKIDKIKIINIPRNKEFTVDTKDLSASSWRLIEKEIENIYGKITGFADKKIKDCFKINQGIITGHDRAFVVNREIIEMNNLEEVLLVDWIKGSALEKKKINDSRELKLIYTNDIDIKEFPNTGQYLEKFKSRLEKRRECQRGYRRWYDLQWGRDKQQFENRKILFPYKSAGNRFVYDNNGYYFSADIYMMTGIIDNLDLKDYTGYLNSEVFEFLVKVTSKKIGKELYEYYPYNILELPFFYSFHKEYNISKNCGNIDLELYRFLDFDNKEIELIRSFIKRG